MATIVKGSTLPATNCSAQNVYDMLENSTISAIAAADITNATITNTQISATAAIAATKLDLTGIDSAMTYASGSHPKRSIILTAQGAMVPSTSGAEQTQTDGTNFSYYTLNFDKDADEIAYWTFVIPDSYDDSDITATIFWTSAVGSATNEVQFELAFLGRINDEVLDAAVGTATAVDDTLLAQNDLHVSAATTCTSANIGWTAGDFVVVKLIRDIDGPSGTDIAGDVKVLAVKLEWGKDQDTD